MASKAKKMFVRRWMSSVYKNYESAVGLAEAAADKFNCYEGVFGAVEEWVFEYAADFCPSIVYED